MSRAPVHARDLRQNIKDYGYEMGTTVTVEMMLEEQVGMRDTIRMLTDMVVRLVDNTEKLNLLNDGLKAKIESIKRVDDNNDEARFQGILPDGDT